MYPYQQQYQPQYRDYRAIGQGPAVTPAPAPMTLPSVPSTGVKVAETLLTVGFTGAVAYTGIRAGLQGKGTLNKTVGWVAGVGGSVLGLAVLTAIVSPSLGAKINPFHFA